MVARRPLGVITVLLLMAPFARAGESDDAKDLFERARVLRAKGDCAGALPLFHKAHEIFPEALGPLRNAAECEEATGRWASARRSWLDLRRALLTTTDPKYAGWSDDADAAARRLEPRISHLTVRVTTRSQSDALEVTINGEPLPRALVGTMLERDPGEYHVRARVPPGAFVERIAVLTVGEAVVVQLVPIEPAARVVVPAPPRIRSTPWSPAGWVALSLGAGAFIGMGVAIGVRQDALSSLSAQCDYARTACASSLAPVVDRGMAASTAVSVLATAGGVAIGAGILMLIIASRTREPAPLVRAMVSPFGVGAQGSF